MIHAIIDIGSNTIRLVMYRDERKKVELLFNKKHMAALASYIKDGEMTAEGIDKACDVLLDFKKLIQAFRVKSVAVFATAALRNATNSDVAVKEIVERTGLTIDVISGNDEAILDFIGATQAVEMQDGILIDVGGASTELVIYENQQILQTASLPIGSLNAYTQYVKHLLPTKAERKAIKQAVLNELGNLPAFTYGAHPMICGVGGSIRATKKLNQALFNVPTNDETISIPNIIKMIKHLENKSTIKDGISLKPLETVLKIVPDRVRTILPGMIILHTLAKEFKSEFIHVSTAGVREGYLYDRIIKRGYSNGQTEKKK